jgi:thioredoxin reductase
VTDRPALLDCLVIGGDRGFAEATVLRSFTADVTLVAPDRDHRLSPDQLRDLEAAGYVCPGQ